VSSEVMRNTTIRVPTWIMKTSRCPKNQWFIIITKGSVPNFLAYLTLHPLRKGIGWHLVIVLGVGKMWFGREMLFTITRGVIRRKQLGASIICI